MGMLRIKNTFISDVQPPIKDGLWLKVVDGGVALYLMENGTPKPLKVIDDGGTSSTADNVVQDLVGKNTDKKTDNTINGAKAYAKDQADTLMGTAEDEATDMTLYGLKAYVDAQIAAID